MLGAMVMLKIDGPSGIAVHESQVWNACEESTVTWIPKITGGGGLTTPPVLSPPPQELQIPSVSNSASDRSFRVSERTVLLRMARLDEDNSYSTRSAPFAQIPAFLAGATHERQITPRD